MSIKKPFAVFQKLLRNGTLRAVDFVCLHSALQAACSSIAEDAPGHTRNSSARVFVSPKGNDTVFDGTFKKPFKTIERALEYMRLLRYARSVTL